MVAKLHTNRLIVHFKRVAWKLYLSKKWGEGQVSCNNKGSYYYPVVCLLLSEIEGSREIKVILSTALDNEKSGIIFQIAYKGWPKSLET